MRVNKWELVSDLSMLLVRI